jgi:hypothetical protein
VKTGLSDSRRNRQVWQNFLRTVSKKNDCFASDDDDDDDDDKFV